MIPPYKTDIPFNMAYYHNLIGYGLDHTNSTTLSNILKGSDNKACWSYFNNELSPLSVSDAGMRKKIEKLIEGVVGPEMKEKKTKTVYRGTSSGTIYDGSKSYNSHCRGSGGCGSGGSYGHHSLNGSTYLHSGHFDQAPTSGVISFSPNTTIFRPNGSRSAYVVQSDFADTNSNINPTIRVLGGFGSCGSY